MIVNAITGASASCRNKKETLLNFMNQILLDAYWADVSAKNYLYSSDNKCVSDTVRFIRNHSDERMLLVGKSLGAVRTWWSIMDHWSRFRDKLNNASDGRLGVVLLDPHGWQKGDGKTGSYGVGLNYLKYRTAWNRDDVRLHVLYQRNDYPKGVRIKPRSNTTNLTNTRLSKDADHWNVTQYHSPTGQTCAQAIENMIAWLNA